MQLILKGFRDIIKDKWTLKHVQKLSSGQSGLISQNCRRHVLSEISLPLQLYNVGGIT